MKDAVIHINTIHDCANGEGDRIDFTTDGYYGLIDGAICLNYMESEVTGFVGTRTSLIIQPEQVTIDRDGLVTSRMIFCKNEKSSFLYDTPIGSATLTITTRSIDMSFDESGGWLSMEYVLDMDHAVIHLNRINIKVSEQKG